MQTFEVCRQRRLWWPLLMLLVLGAGVSVAYGQPAVADELARAITESYARWGKQAVDLKQTSD